MREGGSGWGTHVNPWLIHINVWQKPLKYCKVISLQLIKINGKKRERKKLYAYLSHAFYWFTSMSFNIKTCLNDEIIVIEIRGFSKFEFKSQ